MEDFIGRGNREREAAGEDSSSGRKTVATPGSLFAVLGGEINGRKGLLQFDFCHFVVQWGDVRIGFVRGSR